MGRAPSRRVSPSARWLVVAVVAGSILVASVLPRTAGPVPPAGAGPVGLLGADKWLHAAAYAALAGALVFTLAAPNRPIAATLAVALGAAVGFGLAVELVQAPLPTRRFELLDVAANAAGATLSVLAWWVAGRWREIGPAPS